MLFAVWNNLQITEVNFVLLFFVMLQVILLTYYEQYGIIISMSETFRPIRKTFRKN